MVEVRGRLHQITVVPFDAARTSIHQQIRDHKHRGEQCVVCEVLAGLIGKLAAQVIGVEVE